MSLRDYLLTRMALRQDARQRELDIEQARAARQAGEQAAYAGYGNQLLQGIVKGIGSVGELGAADAAKEADLNKLRLQDALLTTGDNTLADAADADVIPEVYSGSDEGLEGPVPDEVTSPMYDLYDKNTERMRQEDLTAENAIVGSPAPTADAGLASTLSKLIPGSSAGARPMGNESAFPNVNVATPDIGPSSPVDLSLRERKGAVVPGEIPVPAAAPVATPDFSYSREEQSAPAEMPIPPPTAGDVKPMDALSKLGLFSQAKLSSATKEAYAAKAAKETLEKKAALDAANAAKFMAAENAAKAKEAAPIAAPPTTRAMESAALDTRRGGPIMPGAVGDENVPEESSKAYRKRMERKGYSTQKINELSKKYFGSSTGTIDIADETGTAGGPKGATPSIGGTFDSTQPFATVPGSIGGGFGGAPAESEKPWVRGRKTTAPITDAEEAKTTTATGKTTIERLREEERTKAEDFNTRVRNYKRIGNADFKEPDVEKLAEKAVNEIFTKKPAGNPISQMINQLSGRNELTSENERLIRSIAKKSIMKNIIAERTAIADKAQSEFLDTAKLELAASTAQGKSLGLTTSKKQIPVGAKGELDSQRDANKILNQMRDKAYKIAADTGNLPIGPARFLTQARIEKAASAVGSNANAISLGLFGLSGGQSSAQALELKDGLLSKAFLKMDFSDLPADQEDLLRLTQQSVQMLGRAREGGKLTDADYLKYLETLFSSASPAKYMQSVEEAIVTNADKYNSNLEYFNTNYGDNLSMYPPGSLHEQDVDIDWNLITETPLGEAARGFSVTGSKAGGSKKPPGKKAPGLDE